MDTNQVIKSIKSKLEPMMADWVEAQIYYIQNFKVQLKEFRKIKDVYDRFNAISQCWL